MKGVLLFAAAFVMGVVRLSTRAGKVVGDAVDPPPETTESSIAGGESRIVTILVCDLRGFSVSCEALSPPQVVSLLNQYLAEMTAIVAKHAGVIHECVGDTMFVLFDAASEESDHATRAIACGAEMQMAMARLNELTRQELLPELDLGIGIHTGEAVVGQIGVAERAKHGVVGRTVKLTKRIEALAGAGQVLISRATLDAADPNISVGDELATLLPGQGTEPALSLFELVWRARSDAAP